MIQKKYVCFISMLFVVFLLAGCSDNMHNNSVSAANEQGTSLDSSISIHELISGSYTSSDVGSDLAGFSIAFESRGGSYGTLDAFAKGDLNGDGITDYVFSNGDFNNTSSATPYDGRVYINYGPLDQTAFASFDAVIDAASLGAGYPTGDEFGSSLAIADLNGDDKAELIIGAPKNDYYGATRSLGASYVIFGNSTRLSGLYLINTDLGISSTATLQGTKLVGAARSDYAGYVAAPGDINGDGYQDLMIGAPQNDTSASNAGIVYVLFGGAGFNSQFTSREHSVTDIAPAGIIAGFAFTGENASDKLSLSTRAGDVDGDGIDDFILTAVDYNSSAGASYLIYGSSITSGSVSATYALSTVIAGTTDFQGAKYYSTRATDQLGSTTDSAGDLDADGYDDILIGVRYDDDESTSSKRPGCVYVIAGSATRYSGSYELGSYSSTASNYVAKLVGEADSDYAGASLAGVGDVNADGFADIVVGARQNDTAGTNSGKAYLIYGPITGVQELSTVGSTIDGAVFASDTAHGYLGAVVAGLGDFDYDGDDDFTITEPQYVSGTGVGYAYIIYGEPTVEEEQPLFSAAHTVVDFNGDAAEDISFRGSATNDVRIWLMNGAVKTASSYPTDYSQATNYDFVGYGDFNGDAKTDIMWREQTTGEFEIWYMDGLTVSSTVTYADVRDTSYSVLQLTDFDSDGITDILWEDSTTGSLDVWLMDVATIKGTIDFGIPGTGMILQGSGDFNGDGSVDLLYLDPATGLMAISRYMYSRVITSTFTPRLTADFTIQGIADFDADGKDDILTRRTVYSPSFAANHGEIQIWFMNGASLSSMGRFGTLPMNWDIIGIGQFGKEDASKDIAFYNRDTYRTQVWEITTARTRVIHYTAVVSYPSPEDWGFPKLADFDGDGDTDFLLWNPNTFLVFDWVYENYRQAAVGYYGAASMIGVYDIVE